MKNLKKKLFAATAMLLVSAVMLGGSTFAWYTLSTAPEIKAVQFNMSANENLEIALDNGYVDAAAVDEVSKFDANSNGGSKTGNPYTWGNLINLGVAVNDTNNKIALKPVKYNDSVADKLQYPRYDVDGRMKDLVDLKLFNVSDHAGVATAQGGFAVYGQNSTNLASNTTFDAFSVTYWLRSNMATSVSLSANGVKRAQSSEDGTNGATDATDPNLITGQGSYILATETYDKTAKENTDALADLINAGKLVIRLDVGDVSYYARATKGDETNPKATLSLVSDSAATGPAASPVSFALTANTAQKVMTYVYLDGETITNADALLVDLTGITLNLQFVGTNVDDAIDVGSAS